MSKSILHTLSHELNHDALAKRMIQQMDSNSWKLAGEKKEVKVYRFPAIEDGFDGFKTITEHSVSSEEITDLLGRDICGAMKLMNHLYHSGEVLELFYDNGPEDYYAIVRTNFNMPFPLTNREFLHTIKVQRIDQDTVLIMYHSVNDEGLPPVKNKFLRSPTYLSGQRVSTLKNGKVRIEHMMVYALAGNISRGIQNKLFTKGHVDAYLSEWQKLVDHFAK